MGGNLEYLVLPVEYIPIRIGGVVPPVTFDVSTRRGLLVYRYEESEAA